MDLTCYSLYQSHMSKLSSECQGNWWKLSSPCFLWIISLPLTFQTPFLTSVSLWPQIGPAASPQKCSNLLVIPIWKKDKEKTQDRWHLNSDTTEITCDLENSNLDSVFWKFPELGPPSLVEGCNCPVLRHSPPRSHWRTILRARRTFSSLTGKPLATFPPFLLWEDQEAEGGRSHTHYFSKNTPWKCP